MNVQLTMVPAILACCLTTYAAQPKPLPFSDVRLDSSKLKSWGTHTYSMNRTAVRNEIPVTQRVGRASFACEVREKTTRLTNSARMFMPDGKRFIDFRQECVYPEMNLRSLSEIETNVVRSDGVQIKESRATVNLKELVIVDKESGRTSTTKSQWPENGIVDIAVFYFVTILPREPNRRYAIDNFITSSRLQKIEQRVLECHGRDRTTGESGKHWVRFSLYDPGKRADAVQYWVSDDGLLQRVQLNKENRLDLEAAKKSVKPSAKR